MRNKETFFYSRFLFWGFGISVILKIAKNGFWISELLGALIGFVILSLIKRPNEALWFKRLANAVMIFFAVIILANLGGTMYLKQTPAGVLILVPLICGFVVSKSKPQAFKRIIFLLFVYSLIMFFTSGGILINYVNLENLRPFVFDYKCIITGTIIYVLTSVTPILCMNDFQNKKDLLLNYATSTLTILGITFLIVCVLGNKETMLYRYPEFVVLKRIKIYEFFSNVENLFVIMIVTDFISTISTGLKNMSLNSRPFALVSLLVIFEVSKYVCEQSKMMTWLYWFYPVILGVIFIGCLLPLKREKNDKISLKMTE